MSYLRKVEMSYWHPRGWGGARRTTTDDGASSEGWHEQWV